MDAMLPDAEIKAAVVRALSPDTTAACQLMKQSMHGEDGTGIAVNAIVAAACTVSESQRVL
jgi:hypothetical protein